MSKLRLDGRIPKNPSEVKCYNHLKEFIPKELKVEYEPEELPYTVSGKYRPDFRISHCRDDGTHCFIEFKGNGRAFDQKVRQKMIAVKEQHPDKKFYIVFYADGKAGPKRKDGTFFKQSDWSKKNGFEYCIGYNNIPKEWFE